MRISFDRFILDGGTRQLLDADRHVHLEPKAFELLLLLVQERPNVLSKAVLLQRLWPETFVAEANLSNLIAEIRAAIGDRARAPRFIRTAHGFGYAFCGEATTLSPAPEPEAASEHVRAWLEWGGRRFPLSAGDNVLGRDPDVQVTLDSSTISRQHARIVLTPGGAVLDDMESKNGTFLGDERVTSAVQLADGDVIRIGSLVLTFHARTPLGTTDTQRSD
jgi:DNA-binding winged helix-turn-helix (wHTH) protein